MAFIEQDNSKFGVASADNRGTLIFVVDNHRRHDMRTFVFAALAMFAMAGVAQAGCSYDTASKPAGVVADSSTIKINPAKLPQSEKPS